MVNAAYDLASTDHDTLGRKSSEELVLRAAVALVASAGIDNVSMSEVGKVSRVSRTTMYAHFGNTDDIFAEVWANAGAPWLNVRLASPAGSGDGAPVLDLALTDILAAARRVPEIHEVIVPDVQRMWKAVSSAGPSAQTRAAWALAFNIGAPFTAPVVPSVLNMGWLGEFIASIPDDAHTRLDLPPIKRESGSRDWEIETFDASETSDRLMRASVEVVSSSGLRAASLTRIARVARLTSGSASPYFDGLEDLVRKGFVRMMDAVVDKNLGTMAGEASNTLLSDQIAAVLSAAHLPERAMWRRYRRELHLAARTDASLRALMQPTIEDANARIAAFQASRGFDPAVVATVVNVNQALVEGFSILHDIGIDIATVDHRIATRWLNKAMFEP